MDRDEGGYADKIEELMEIATRRIQKSQQSDVEEWKKGLEVFEKQTVLPS